MTTKTVPRRKSYAKAKTEKKKEEEDEGLYEAGWWWMDSRQRFWPEELFEGEDHWEGW